MMGPRGSCDRPQSPQRDASLVGPPAALGGGKPCSFLPAAPPLSQCVLGWAGRTFSAFELLPGPGAGRVKSQVVQVSPAGRLAGVTAAAADHHRRVGIGSCLDTWGLQTANLVRA